MASLWGVKKRAGKKRGRGTNFKEQAEKKGEKGQGYRHNVLALALRNKKGGPTSVKRDAGEKKPRQELTGSKWGGRLGGGRSRKPGGQETRA